MLVELAIRNFAIIDSVRIPFGPGLNVLTGETGAGKSILIDALGAVLGDRVSSDLVRTGARSATVDATFDLERLAAGDDVMTVLDELAIDADDGLLIVSREIQSSGRSVARLNGRPTTATILGQIGAHIVDIHGQSDHLSLLRPVAQLDLLDRYARVMPERDELKQRLDALRQTLATLTEVLGGARDRMQRIDLLQFQIDEIARANLRIGEEAELTSERSRLANADRLARDAAAIYAGLVGDDDVDLQSGAMPALRQATALLQELAEIDPETGGIGARLNEVVYLLEDIAADVRTYRDGIEADPARLLVVEERLAELRHLMRKYGADVGEILAHGQAAEEELERLTGSESDAETLAAREAAQAREVGELAGELSARRAEAAIAMAADVERAIAQLNMGTALFVISLDRIEDPRGVPVRGDDGFERTFAVDATGIDRAVFLIAPNAGEALKPLSRIVSGGETARLMLALKSILSDADRTPTLVFDEIDVGVGGRSGQVVGEKLWGLSHAHQVIAITHLPQIAAFADCHFRIAKEERDGRVVSLVDELEDAARDEELAAMLDGVPITASALQSAHEMIARANVTKRKLKKSA
jgi:DNA repair protein RecN (Recombination protein N)